MNAQSVRMFAISATVLSHTLVLGMSFLNYDPDEVTYDADYTERIFQAVLLDEPAKTKEEEQEEERVQPEVRPPPPQKKKSRPRVMKKKTPPVVQPQKKAPEPVVKKTPPTPVKKATQPVQRSRRAKNQINATPAPIVSTTGPGGRPAPNLNSGGTEDAPSTEKLAEETAEKIARGKREKRRLEKDYYGQLTRYFERHYGYPKRARLARIEGEVWIEVIIAPTGELLSHRIYRSSGSKILDEAALKDVAKLSSVPPPPKGAKWRQAGRKVRIPFRYKLRT